MSCKEECLEVKFSGMEIISAIENYVANLRANFRIIDLESKPLSYEYLSYLNRPSASIVVLRESGETASGISMSIPICELTRR